MARNQGGRPMDPVQPRNPQADPQAGPAPQNGAQPAQGAAEPLLTPPASGPATETDEAAAARMAAQTADAVGGLIARVDQLETKVLRVDRQVLVLIGMVAVLSWGVKSIAGKVAVADAAAATAS